MNTRGKTLGAWFGHPVTVVALLVLVVNDHVLKGAYPGVVTGKLSDAAGLVLAPPLLALLVRRPAAALWSVAVGFSLVKSSGYAAALASGLWSVVHGPSSVIRADWTDLLTLPFLGVAWWAYRCAARQPVATRWVRALRMAVVLPLALGGVAATSEVQVSAASRVVSTADAIYLISLTSQGAEEWAVSVDDGTSWKSMSSTPLAPPKKGPQTRQACSKANKKICYRVLSKAIGVQRSADGGATWTTDWRVGDDDRLSLSRQYPRAGDNDVDLVSVAVAVHDTDDGRHIVVLANRRDGFALRDEDGQWQRIGFPEIDSQEVPALGEKRIEEVGFDYGALGIVVTTVLALVVVAGAGAMRRRWWIGLPVLAVVPPALLLMGYAGLDPDSIVFYPFVLIGPVVSIVGCLAVAIGATVSVHRGGDRRGWWAAGVWVLGVLAAAAAAAAWFFITPMWAQIAADVAAAVVGMVLAALLSRTVPPSRPGTSAAAPYAQQRVV
ncbi:hypothetical protein AB0M20_01710 [Actinoplanes sp. NPDC051633]|uniref:hypothetical protein n=1 Tax=Actinoplanes sp. NPDC051633 TaxID=3155670 RepID=UPI003446615A